MLNTLINWKLYLYQSEKVSFFGQLMCDNDTANQIEAFDFLLKPFKDEKFSRTTNKLLRVSPSEAKRNFDKIIEELLKICPEELILIGFL